MANASMPWVKLYIDMLDDHKLGKLPRSARLRFVELLLIAGECDADGGLINGDVPMTIEDVAWRLRDSQECVTADIAALTTAGLLNSDADVLCITNFSKRQGRSQSDKRAQWRERKARQKESDPKDESDSRVNHAGVTQDSLTREEKSREEKKEGAANAEPIIATIPATADVANSTDMNTSKVDAVTDFFNRATKVKTHRDTINAWRGAEHLKGVCIALCDATGLPVQKGDSGKWLKGATALHELGVTADILKRVWNEATERDRQFMTHPAAFVERVRGAMAAIPAATTTPTRRIVDWQEQPDGSMLPVYEAVQA